MAPASWDALPRGVVEQLQLAYLLQACESAELQKQRTAGQGSCASQPTDLKAAGPHFQRQQGLRAEQEAQARLQALARERLARQKLQKLQEKHSRIVAETAEVAVQAHLDQQRAKSCSLDLARLTDVLSGLFEEADLLRTQLLAAESVAPPRPVPAPAPEPSRCSDGLDAVHARALHTVPEVHRAEAVELEEIDLQGQFLVPEACPRPIDSPSWQGDLLTPANVELEKTKGQACETDPTIEEGLSREQGCNHAAQQRSSLVPQERLEQQRLENQRLQQRLEEMRLEKHLEQQRFEQDLQNKRLEQEQEQYRFEHGLQERRLELQQEQQRFENKLLMQRLHLQQQSEPSQYHHQDADEDRAATMLQARWRGVRARTEVAEMLRLQELANSVRQREGLQAAIAKLAQRIEESNHPDHDGASPLSLEADAFISQPASAEGADANFQELTIAASAALSSGAPPHSGGCWLRVLASPHDEAIGWVAASVPPGRVFTLNVRSEGLADRFGIRPRDELVYLNDEQVDVMSENNFIEAMRARPLTMDFVRTEEVQEEKVEVMAAPVQQEVQAQKEHPEVSAATPQPSSSHVPAASTVAAEKRSSSKPKKKSRSQTPPKEKHTPRKSLADEAYGIMRSLLAQAEPPPAGDKQPSRRSSKTHHREEASVEKAKRKKDQGEAEAVRSEAKPGKSSRSYVEDRRGEDRARQRSSSAGKKAGRGSTPPGDDGGVLQSYSSWLGFTEAAPLEAEKPRRQKGSLDRKGSPKDGREKRQKSKGRPEDAVAAPTALAPAQRRTPGDQSKGHPPSQGSSFRQPAAATHPSQSGSFKDGQPLRQSGSFGQPAEGGQPLRKSGSFRQPPSVAEDSHPVRLSGSFRQPPSVNEDRRPLRSSSSMSQPGDVAHGSALDSVPVHLSEESETYEVVARDPSEPLGFMPSALAPERVFVTQIGYGEWSDRQGVAVGDELLEVNGHLVTHLQSADMKQMMRLRPLTLKFVRARFDDESPVDTAVSASQVDNDVLSNDELEILAGQEVRDLGFLPSGFPPDPVYVESFAGSSWCERQGVVVGSELLRVNGRPVDEMDKAELKAVMRQRPLRLAFSRDAVLEDGSEIEISVDQGVTALGFRPSNMPPEPIVLEGVGEDSWAARQGLADGDELLEVNHIAIQDYAADAFTSAMRARPLQLLLFRYKT